MNWKEEVKRKQESGEFSTDSDVFEFCKRHHVKYSDVNTYLEKLETIGTPCEGCRHIIMRHSMYPCNMCHRAPGMMDRYEVE